MKKKAGLMGNPRKAPVPALQREPQVEPDSSNEEAERLQLHGSIEEDEENGARRKVWILR